MKEGSRRWPPGRSRSGRSWRRKWPYKLTCVDGEERTARITLLRRNCSYKFLGGESDRITDLRRCGGKDSPSANRKSAPALLSAYHPLSVGPPHDSPAPFLAGKRVERSYSSSSSPWNCFAALAARSQLATEVDVQPWHCPTTSQRELGFHTCAYIYIHLHTYTSTNIHILVYICQSPTVQAGKTDPCPRASKFSGISKAGVTDFRTVPVLQLETCCAFLHKGLTQKSLVRVRNLWVCLMLDRLSCAVQYVLVLSQIYNLQLDKHA